MRAWFWVQPKVVGQPRPQVARSAATWAASRVSVRVWAWLLVPRCRGQWRAVCWKALMQARWPGRVEAQVLLLVLLLVRVQRRTQAQAKEWGYGFGWRSYLVHVGSDVQGSWGV